MLKLFSKRNRMFSHVRAIDPKQLPITTGFDFFDRFLAAAAEVHEQNQMNYWEIRDLDSTALLKRFPFFREILEGTADTRAQAYVLQMLLPTPDYRFRRNNKNIDFVCQTLTILGERLRENGLAPVSEFLVLEFINELDEKFIASPFVDMLLKSFGKRTSRALRKSLSDLIDRCSNSDKSQPWDYIKQLEHLVIFVGRNPKENQLIAEATWVIEQSRNKQENLLARLDPLFTRHYLALERDYKGSSRASKRAETWKPLNAKTPLERGKFVADMVTIRREIHTDPFWKEIRRWQNQLPCFQPEKIEEFYRAYRDHQRILNRKMELTSDQAYLLLEDALGVFGHSYKLQVRLSLPLVRTLVKYMEPRERPDLLKLIDQNRQIKANIKSRLIQAMLGGEKLEDNPQEFYLKEVSEKREKLKNIFRSFPNLFFKIGNVFSIGTGKSERDLFALDHQAFPYFPEINGYLDAVARAMTQGLVLKNELDELARFHGLISENIVRLEVGEGRLGKALYPFTKDVLVFRRNRERFPSRVGSGAAAPASVDLEEVIAAERDMLNELGCWLQILAWHHDNLDFVRWRANVAPGDAASKPSAKWIENARKTLSSEAILNYLANLEPVPGSVPYSMYAEPTDSRIRFTYDTARYDKGVIWAAHLCDPEKAGPLLVDYIKRCFVTLPGVGIKAEKLGNAALWALQNMPDGKGVPYLAHVLARNKYPKVRKKINAALDAAAAEADMSRAELDELTAPDHQMADGVKRVEIGQGVAVLTCEGSKIQVSWEDSKGVVRKAPPKVIKDADPDGIRAAKANAKEIEQDLATQSLRLEGLFLKQISWSFEEWRERYADHGTLAMLVRRLIWKADLPGGAVIVLPTEYGCMDVNGRAVDCSGAQIHMWHPIDADENEILLWRERLLDLGIQQPFKQAWREVYRLTDAERETATYSNRFAGHIIRQHQMMTLAQLNGWKCKHRMWVDAPNDEPSHITLQDYGLYAEFWTAGAGGEDPPVLDSGAYVYLTTDRLKFFRLDAAAAFGRGVEVGLDQVPAIIFSEIMRYCDLFTSVPSISLDSEWVDRGEDAEHPNQWRRKVANPYWQHGQVTDLGTAAQGRREVLAAIMPRLKSSAAFSLEERYLNVKGVLNSYRIHLGSGAVQLMPSARHISIVKAPTTSKRSIRLPFEGDSILSLVLSKALMLAQDDKITDPVILQQLR